MKKTLYYRNDRWHTTTELDHPVEPAHYDNSLVALARLMICEIRAQIKAYRIQQNRR